MLRVLLVVLFISVPVAHADEGPSVTARNKEAIELSKGGEFSPAIEIWLELLSETGTDYEYRWVFHKNIGRNYQKLGRNPEAWWHLTQAWELSGGGKSKKLLTWVGEVETTMGDDHTKIHLEGEREGTAVLFPEDEHGYVYRTPLDWWFPHGEALLQVTAPNRESVARSFSVTEEPRTVNLVLPMPHGWGVLVLKGDPDAEILVDGEVAGVGEAEVETAEGTHIVEARKGGDQIWIGEVVVLSRKTVTKDVRAPVIPPPPPPPRVAPWKWALLAGGVAAAASGGVTWWLAGENLDDQRGAYQGWLDTTYDLGGAVPTGSEAAATKEWNDRVARKVTPAQISSYVLWGVGGAMVATSAILIGLDLAKDDDADKPVMTVQPWALPGGAGFATMFTF